MVRSPTKAAAAAALCATTASAFHPPDVVGTSSVMRPDPNPYGGPTPAPRPAPRPTARRKKTQRKMVDVNQAADEAVAPRDNTQDLLRGAVAVGLLGFGTVAWVQEFLATQAPGLAVSAMCLLGGWAALVSRVTGGVPDDFYDNSQS